MTDNDEQILSSSVCQQRSEEFAEITGTDTALAMFYLQDRAWDVQRSLNAYFEDQGGQPSGGGAARHPRHDEAWIDDKPHRIRVISWNIDGLDENVLVMRVKAVCTTIIKEEPDVVFLQEVVPQHLEILKSECVGYKLLKAGAVGYFTAILLRYNTATYQSDATLDFPTSSMMRNLLMVNAKVKGIDCLLMTSHLESTKDHGFERKKQLQVALRKMQKAEPGTTVIFGGDLNIRDKEVQEIGGLPDGIYDIWQVTGQRPEAKFTWDITRNDNLEWPHKFRPRCRFDRLYIRHSSPKKLVLPVYFELIGLERLLPCRRFPSDHWGILAHFDKVKSK